jgi:para-aminobenzoate synthetase component 1
LKKEGSRIISQPMKETGARNRRDEERDLLNKTNLFTSSKERTENVMIVDLVRNDLSKICEEGTVKVDELFGIYSYPQVHQMISTVSGLLRKDLHWSDAIKATFPMGSMTGAPEKRVMQLIETYKKTKEAYFQVR